jgi:hypothetical protein
LQRGLVERFRNDFDISLKRLVWPKGCRQPSPWAKRTIPRSMMKWKIMFGKPPNANSLFSAASVKWKLGKDADRVFADHHIGRT